MATATTALILRPVASRPIVHVPKSRTKSVEIDTITVGELCEHFLHHKRTMVSIGELCERTIEHYERAATALIQRIGADSIAADLLPDDFLEIRAHYAESWGPHRLMNLIQSIRSIFKYGYDCGLLDRPMRFGPGFKRPAAKLFRRARREAGIKMFEAEELRAIIEAAQPRVRPMILLGINCGLGNSDCGRLHFENLDLDKGILDYPRPKTECDRRAFLWPETVIAIRRAITLRNAPISPDLKEAVFLTGKGYCWCDSWGSSSLGKEFDKTVKRAGIEQRGRCFYTLRRTFRTVADEVGDQPAAMLIMGHLASSTDMSAIYRQRISDDRLRIVADYVRGWLYPSDKANFIEAYQQQAKEILKLWEGRERLMAADVFQALRNLKMTQAELARYLGLCAGWINTVVCGREPISSDTDLKLRAFIQSLAEGKHPQPVDKKALRPQFLHASDVPLPDEVRAALMHDPLLHEHFRVFADHLIELGITRRTLAEWWGYKWKFINELAWGRYKHTPRRGANRLREIFGLPQIEAVDWTPQKMPKPGEIPAPPEIEALFDGREFGIIELRAVLKYLRQTFRFETYEISRWLGYGTCYLGNDVLKGRAKTITFTPRLRALFAFAQTGGVE